MRKSAPILGRLKRWREMLGIPLARLWLGLTLTARNRVRTDGPGEDSAVTETWIEDRARPSSASDY
jgi:hypothetical protein